MSPLVLTIIQLLVVLGIAPLVTGGVRFVKARFQGRHGAVPWRPYVTYAMLMKKENVLSHHASWLSRVAPYAILTSTIFLCAVLPLVSVGGAAGGFSHFYLVAGVLVLNTAMHVLAALDSGSAFGGLGASRLMTTSSLLVPTTLLTFTAFAIVTGSFAIEGMIAGQATQAITLVSHPFIILPIISLMLIALAENTRYPIDDPAGQQELASIQAGPTLDYAGPFLFMLEYAASLKFTVFALLVANFVLPYPLLTSDAGVSGIFLVILATLMKLGIVVVVLALLESTVVRMRFYRLQEYLTGAFFVALTGLALALFSNVL